MKALVTGAEGFVGGHLIRHLLEKGHEVVATYRDEFKNDAVTSYEADILDRTALYTIFKQEKPEVIFHLAAISNVKYSFENPEETFRVNVQGTKNVLEEAMPYSPKIVVVGSANEYGIPTTIPITEEHPLNPNNPYAKSKVEAERLAMKYPLEIYLTRSFNHIGVGQSPNFAVSSFAKQIMEKNTISVGNLEAKRDFTDVRDVVAAYLLLVEKAQPGIYNVCSGNLYSMQQILEKLIELSRKKIEVVPDPSRMRPSDIPVLQGDYTKLREATGWQPTIPLEQSLKDILEWWK